MGPQLPVGEISTCFGLSAKEISLYTLLAASFRNKEYGTLCCLRHLFSPLPSTMIYRCVCSSSAHSTIGSSVSSPRVRTYEIHSSVFPDNQFQFPSFLTQKGILT